MASSSRLGSAGHDRGSFPIFRQELSLPCDVAHNALFWRSPEASCIGLFSGKGFAMPCTWVLGQAGQLSRKYLIT
jgi:hypothetical protein